MIKAAALPTYFEQFSPFIPFHDFSLCNPNCQFEHIGVVPLSLSGFVILRPGRQQDFVCIVYKSIFWNPNKQTKPYWRNKSTTQLATCTRTCTHARQSHIEWQMPGGHRGPDVYLEATGLPCNVSKSYGISPQETRGKEDGQYFSCN